MEGLHLIEPCSHLRMNLLLFDFAGAGHSEGEYVSLGWFESLDLALVIQDAKARFNIGPVSIWGRSMGAVASILYAEKNQADVQALILDSPFSCLKGMIEQIGLDKFGMPAFVVKIAMKVISGTVHQKLGVNIFDLQPAKNAEKCNIPALFIVAKNDQILPPMSVMEIYNNYPATKKVIIHSADGGHSSEREPHIIARGFDLIGDQLMKHKISTDARLHDPHGGQSRKTHVFFDPFHSDEPVQLSHRPQEHSTLRIDDPFLQRPKQEAHSFSQHTPRPFNIANESSGTHNDSSHRPKPYIFEELDSMDIPQEGKINMSSRRVIGPHFNESLSHSHHDQSKVVHREPHHESHQLSYINYQTGILHSTTSLRRIKVTTISPTTMAKLSILYFKGSMGTDPTNPSD
jgi:hypothetical protein